MSCDTHEIWLDMVEERAYEDCCTLYEREPTIEELEDMIECLIDKWR